MLFFASFLLLAIISKIKSEEISNKLGLILVNGNSSQCPIYNGIQMGICIDETYTYVCHNTSDNNGNITLQCSLKNETVSCGTGKNVTLYCGHDDFNFTSHNIDYGCTHSAYENGSTINGNRTLICYSAISSVVSTSGTSQNSTGTSQSSTQNSGTSQNSTQNSGTSQKKSMHVFGKKVTKRIAEIFAIALLAAIIIICCCTGWCCFSCCKNMCESKSKSKNDRENQRMPQSNVSNI